MWIIFWFDPRFLWFKDDSNWSHAEYQIMAGQSDKSMTNFADTLEEFMLSATIKAYRDFPYDWIELINDQFLDKQLKQDLIVQKVEKWLLTPKQWIIELWYKIYTRPKTNWRDNKSYWYRAKKWRKRRYRKRNRRINCKKSLQNKKIVVYYLQLFFIY